MPLSAFGDGGLSVAGGGDAPLENSWATRTVGSPEYHISHSQQSREDWCPLAGLQLQR